jgi:hypothetical protein
VLAPSQMHVACCARLHLIFHSKSRQLSMQEWMQVLPRWSQIFHRVVIEQTARRLELKRQAQSSGYSTLLTIPPSATPYSVRQLCSLTQPRDTFATFPDLTLIKKPSLHSSRRSDPCVSLSLPSTPVASFSRVDADSSWPKQLRLSRQQHLSSP